MQQAVPRRQDELLETARRRFSKADKAFKVLLEEAEGAGIPQGPAGGPPEKARKRRNAKVRDESRGGDDKPLRGKGPELESQWLNRAPSYPSRWDGFVLLAEG